MTIDIGTGLVTVAGEALEYATRYQEATGGKVAPALQIARDMWSPRAIVENVGDTAAKVGGISLAAVAGLMVLGYLLFVRK